VRAGRAGLRQALLAAALGWGAATAGSEAPAADPRRSSFLEMSPATQALQRDDSLNPGLLWLQGGEQDFARDCKRCHDPGAMRGVAARYPAWDERLGKPLTLQGRIQQCRVRHLQQPPLPAESDALLGLETYLARASRGQPIAPPADARLQAWQARGQALFHQPLGQLALSCAQCHDQHAGGRLAGVVIPQGHPTGYPQYRLEWQTMGSLPRRLRNCMTGVRAEPYAPGSDEFTALEAYLMQRAAGMPLEAPAVRP
jgi:sulfur-oxidizing protein SoxA